MELFADFQAELAPASLKTLERCMDSPRILGVVDARELAGSFWVWPVICMLWARVRGGAS